MGYSGLLKFSQLLCAMLAIIGLSYPMIALAGETGSKFQNKVSGADFEFRQVHVRSLAASCAACHGTNGNNSASDHNANKIVSLAGMDSADFIAKMHAFKSGDRTATVMHHHAKGLNPQEISDLAEYFSTQIPHTPVPLVSQTLLKSYAN